MTALVVNAKGTGVAVRPWAGDPTIPYSTVALP